MRPGGGTASKGAIPAMTSPCLVNYVSVPANTCPAHHPPHTVAQAVGSAGLTANFGAGIRGRAAQPAIHPIHHDSSTLQRAQSFLMHHGNLFSQSLNETLRLRPPRNDWDMKRNGGITETGGRLSAERRTRIVQRFVIPV